VACANGPCASPSAVAFVAGAGLGAAPVAVANFGLLMGGGAGGGWQFVCDDVYGTPLPELVRPDGRGRVLAAGAAGLTWSADGCSWEAAAGAVARREVLDLAFAGAASAAEERVWALAADGEARVLALSTDGGATFELVHSFSDGLAYARLLVAPSDGQRLYVTGAGAAGAGVTVLASSTDGGATWASRELTGGLTPPLENTLVPLAVAPADPGVLFFSLVDAQGDEIWLSEDGGRSVRRVLDGGPRDWMTGLAFGPGQTVYAAAAVIPVIDDGPPGHLFVSRDGGRTWAPPRPSARTGPAYRCLHAAAGKLYACDLGGPTGEAFLVGASTDEGQTWTPVVRLQELTGARTCVRAACAATEAWFCDRYGHCPAPPSPAPPPPDASDPSLPPRDAATNPDARPATCTDGPCDRANPGEGGCSCSLGGRGGPASSAPQLPFPALLGALLATLLTTRRRQTKRPARTRQAATPPASCDTTTPRDPIPLAPHDHRSPITDHRSRTSTRTRVRISTRRPSHPT
jgi:MYXO-CTERM domain-containing protein